MKLNGRFIVLESYFLGRLEGSQPYAGRPPRVTNLRRPFPPGPLPHSPILLLCPLLRLSIPAISGLLLRQKLATEAGGEFKIEGAAFNREGRAGSIMGNAVGGGEGGGKLKWRVGSWEVEPKTTLVSAATMMESSWSGGRAVGRRREEEGVLLEDIAGRRVWSVDDRKLRIWNEEKLGGEGGRELKCCHLGFKSC